MYLILTLLVLLGTLLARSKLNRRERQEQLHKLNLLRVPWAFLLQPYTCFLFALALYYVVLTTSLLMLMVRYSGLDPSTFHRPTSNSSLSAEMEDFDIPSGVGALCKLSPIFVAATFVITAFHLWKHVPCRQPEFCGHLRWFPTFSHDLAMQVVALPLVYGLFALDNVVEMLRVFTGHAYMRAYDGKAPGSDYVTWITSVELADESYETNFQIADLYEAWALRCFGYLCFALVLRQVRRESPTVKYLVDSVQEHLRTLASEGGCEDPALSEHPAPGARRRRDLAMLKDLRIFSQPEKLLFQPFLETSRLGVLVFVYTYAVKSFYSLALTILAEPPLSLQLCGKNGVLAAVCSLKPYAEGAAMLASTLAIMNIILFEPKLKTILPNFHPLPKFLAVKLLVSISFIQSYGLNVLLGGLCSFSTAQINLCYASLICFEVLPLSIFVFATWRPAEHDWYDGDKYSVDEIVAARIELADDNADFMKSDAFIESRKPSSAFEPGDPFALKAVVELRGDVKLKDGEVIERLIDTLSNQRIRAEYKHVSLYPNAGVTCPACSSGKAASGSQ